MLAYYCLKFLTVTCHNNSNTLKSFKSSPTATCYSIANPAIQPQLVCGAARDPYAPLPDVEPPATRAKCLETSSALKYVGSLKSLLFIKAVFSYDSAIVINGDVDITAPKQPQRIIGSIDQHCPASSHYVARKLFKLALIWSPSRILDRRRHKDNHSNLIRATNLRCSQ